MRLCALGPWGIIRSIMSMMAHSPDWPDWPDWPDRPDRPDWSPGSPGPVSRGAVLAGLPAGPLIGLLVGLLVGVMLSGCAMNPERLPELDRRFYYILENSREQEEFLRTRDEDRQALLEREGLWAKWIALSPDERTATADGNVELGFQEFATFMAWGPPADTLNRDVNGQPTRQHTFIRCTSGPKAGRYVQANLECDGTSTEIMVSIRDGKVAEINYPH